MVDERFKEFIYYKNAKEGKKISRKSDINNILESENLHWLIDSEFEDAQIEIKNGTVIWNGGKYYSGNWHYGIFKDGIFYGNFINGILEGGIFRGKFYSGVKMIEI